VIATCVLAKTCIKKLLRKKSFSYFLIIFIFALTSLFGFQKSEAIEPKINPPSSTGEIIVKFKPEAAQKIEEKLNKNLVFSPSLGTKDFGVESLNLLQRKTKISRINPIFKEIRSKNLNEKIISQLKPIYKIKVEDTKDISLLLTEIRKDPQVLWAEPNYLVQAYEVTPNDPFYSQQWALSKISAPQAWEYLSGLEGKPGVPFLDQEYTLGSQALNLKQDYQEGISQDFTPFSAGLLEKIEVEVGTWGSGTYLIFGKVTDERGNLLAEGSVSVGPAGTKPGWINLNLKSKPRIYPGNVYRLYLRQSVSWSSFYWKYNSKAGKKNYKLYLSTPSPALTETLVAVVDTGVDDSHEDLKGKVLPGRNFVDPDNPSSDTRDIHGHGTHVAGIIAASFNNSLGIAGIIPEKGEDSKIKILPVKGLGDNGYGSFAGLAQALLWAAQNNAKVINASWGAGIYSQLLKETLSTIETNYDCQVVAAAGNERLNLDIRPHSIGGYKEVITVGASDQNDQLSIWQEGFSGSNFGFRMDLVAPGTSILSLLPGGRYESWSGTSMATPHVTGVYAVLKSLHPLWTKDQIRKVINLGVDDLGEPGKDETFGFGRLNFQKALMIEDSNSLPVAEITSPANDTVAFGGKINLLGKAYGKNFKEYRVSLKTEGSSLPFRVIYTSSTPVNTSQSLLPEIDLGQYQGKWVILRLETFLSSFPYYNAATVRVFVNPVRGWSKKFSPTALTSPALGDFNNDGLAEIFTTGGNSFPIEPEKLYLFNYNGQDFPGWPKSFNSYSQPYQPIISELEGGKKIIVVPGYSLGGTDQIFALDEKGNLLPGWPLGGIEIQKRPAVGDINLDGKKEIVFISSPKRGDDPWYNEIFAYNFTDSDKDGKPDLVSGWKNPVAYLLEASNPVVADLNNDGYQEIMFTGEDRNYKINFYILDHLGNFWREVPKVFDEEFWENYQPVVIDLDKDNDYEVLITLKERIYAFDFDGEQHFLSRWIYETPATILNPPLVGDLDGNGSQEIVFAETDSNGLWSIKILNSAGQEIQKIPLENEYLLENRGEGVSLSLADLNGDNKLEIVASLLRVASSQYYLVSVWEIFPQLKRTFDAYLTGEVALSSPIVGDLDNNNRFDLLINTLDGRLNVFEYPQNYNSAALKLPWPMFNHDSQNTRNYNFTFLVPTPTPTPTPTATPTPSCPDACPTITSWSSGWTASSGCYVRLSWTAVSGASSYRIYRNQSYQETTQTTYTWNWLPCNNTSLYSVSPVFTGCPVKSCPGIGIKTP